MYSIYFGKTGNLGIGIDKDGYLSIMIFLKKVHWICHVYVTGILKYSKVTSFYLVQCVEITKMFSHNFFSQTFQEINGFISELEYKLFSRIFLTESKFHVFPHIHYMCNSNSSFYLLLSETR